MTDGEVFVLRDTHSPTGEVWQVKWDGRICSPTWMERGPAVAYLESLRKGRKPEYIRGEPQDGS